MASHLSLRKGSIASRGTTIITQKENKGEYGSSWKWNNSSYDWDIYVHVLDQTNSSGTPYRYASATSTGTCPSADIENSTTLANRATNLYGNNNQKISNQTSCKPNTLNAGNWYSFSAATAGSDMHSKSSYPSDAKNSICPKGWQLPPNAGNKSYDTLTRTASDIHASPLSFVRLGRHYYSSGSPEGRGDKGYYWSSTASNSVGSYGLYFGSGFTTPQDSSGRAYYGISIRCVSR